MMRPLVRRLALWLVERRVREQGGTLSFASGSVSVHRDGRTVVLSDAHLQFAPEIAHHFDSYFHAVGSLGDAAVRDYSVPRNHMVPALGIPFWLAGPTESIALLDAYLSDVVPTTGDLVFDLGARSGLTTYPIPAIARC